MLLLLFLCVNVVASQGAHKKNMQLWVKTSGGQTDEFQFKWISIYHLVECLAKDSENIDVCLYVDDPDMKSTIATKVTWTKQQTKQCECNIDYLPSSDVAIFGQGKDDEEGLFTLDMTQRKFLKTIDIKVPENDWWTVDSKSCHIITVHFKENDFTKVNMYCLNTGKLLFKIFEASSKVFVSHYDRNTKHLYYVIKKGTWQLIAINVRNFKHCVIAKEFEFVGDEFQIAGEEESCMIVWCSAQYVHTYEYNYVIYNMSEKVKPRPFTKVGSKFIYSFVILNGSIVFESGDEAVRIVPDLSTGVAQVLRRCSKPEDDLGELGVFGSSLYMTCLDGGDDGHFYVFDINGSTVHSIPDHLAWLSSAVG